MRTKPGIPLRDRSGPVSPVVAPPAADPAAGATGGPAAPAGTGCWIDSEHPPIPGVVLDWRQHTDGQWYALVTAWLPRSALTPRP